MEGLSPLLGWLVVQPTSSEWCCGWSPLLLLPGESDGRLRWHKPTPSHRRPEKETWDSDPVGVSAVRESKLRLNDSGYSAKTQISSFWSKHLSPAVPKARPPVPSPACFGCVSVPANLVPLQPPRCCSSLRISHSLGATCRARYGGPALWSTATFQQCKGAYFK